MKYTNYHICYWYHYVLKCKNEKCIWKIFVKYTQICQSNTNTNTNISSCGFSNTNTNIEICVFKYKYKYKYVFEPSPGNYIHICMGPMINSLVPGRSGCNFKNATFSLVLLVGIFRYSYDNALRLMPRDLANDLSMLAKTYCSEILLWSSKDFI